jgi:hypothetical protein
MAAGTAHYETLKSAFFPACGCLLGCVRTRLDNGCRMGRSRSVQTGRQVLCLALLGAASAAGAARQGSLEATSSGSIGISVSIASQAKMSGPQDVVFGSAGKATRPVLQNLCLSSNSPAGSYTVAAVGSGDAGAFELVSGGRTIGYTVELAGRTGAGERGPASTQLRAAVREADCREGRGSTALTVAIDPALVEQLHSGEAFTGTLTLIVAPE